MINDEPIRIWEKYIQDLYDSENYPKDIAIEEEQNDKGSTIIKSEGVNAMWRRKATGDNNIPVDLFK